MLTSNRAGQADVVGRATAEVRARIVDLRLPPGRVVSELSLAADLGIARGPLREALNLLCAEGLVELVPRRGFVVTVPTVEQMQEIYEIVCALESQAVRRAAREAGPILLAALDAALDDQEEALTSGDQDAWARADRRFHELLREASANRQMAALYQQFDAQLRRVRLLTVPHRQELSLSSTDHRAILAAIRRHDEDGAVSAHQAHRQRSDREILAALDRYIGTLGG